MAVKAERRFQEHFRSRGARVLHKNHPAVVEGRTLFPKNISVAGDVTTLLKSGGNSRKLGSHIVKGALYGAPIFSLTLHERSTCPRDCAQWRSCFGNRMQWPSVRRIEPDADLMPRLEVELRAMARLYRRFMVRLHVLGDFYSVEYVLFWRRMLLQLQSLHVFGYTARNGCDIARAIERLNCHPRCWIRWSDGPVGSFRSVVVENVDQAREAGVIICPAQHHPKSDAISCGSCALCWSTTRDIGFLPH